MASGLGLLFAGLAGGSRGLSDTLEQEQKVNDESTLMKLRSDLDEQKSLRIAEANRVATRQAGIQQGKDITSETQRLQNQRDAEAINAANASTMTAEDAAVLRDKPEARKEYGLLNPTRQSDLEDRATAATNLGYLDAARETRGELATEVQGQRYEQQSKDTNRRLDISEANAKAQQEFKNRMEERSIKVSEAQIAADRARESSANSRAEKAAADAARNATIAAMKGSETEAKQLQKELADPMLSPDQKAVLQDQLNLSRAEARRYRNALGGAGIEGGKAPDKEFDPNKYRTGGNSSASSGGNRVPNPLQEDAPSARTTKQPAAEETPRQMALRALDAAMQTTSRQMAAANSSNDRAEVARLSEVFRQQNEARQRAMQQ